MKTKSKNPIVEKIKEDFEIRQKNRKALETTWQMNMNFYNGNQFCSVGYGGTIEDFEKQFFWQEREAFNHIAPILETRFAKLSKIKPKVTVVPASSDENDVSTAKVSKKVLQSVANKISLSEKISQATKWSEICGTSFYKVFWNNNLGQVVAIDENGKEIKGGDVDVSVCSPFEIFPDNDTTEDIDRCESIIHARVCSKEEIKSMYGVEVEGKNINVYGFDSTYNVGGLGYEGIGTKITDQKKKNCEIVIEKYIKPNKNFPEGKLYIVVGDELVYDGDLPYKNGVDGERGFPFVKQVAIENTGSFWGNSVVERLIPVQRAYNAVKNRKHEFLNRLSMGILNVEDGSIDLENLEEEGLCPGKIIVYRQGSKAPTFLDMENLPTSFAEEETKLLDEFRNISGITEITDSKYISGNLSGTALELMVEQSELRLNSSSDQIKNAIKKVAKQILRLYKQFVDFPRLNKIVGDNGKVELFYFTKNDISSDDIAFETEIELGETPAQKRQIIMELFNAGLLTDEKGQLTNRMKSKILELLGFGIWENALDINDLHIKKAKRENLKMQKLERCEVLDIDDDQTHINEHIAFMLTDSFDKMYEKNPEIRTIFLEHINIHKEKLRLKGE